MIRIQQQIDEVERELALRARVYPGQISRGALRQSEADYAVATLRAAKDTLIWCRDNRGLVAEVKRQMEARS